MVIKLLTEQSGQAQNTVKVISPVSGQKKYQRAAFLGNFDIIIAVI